MRPRCKQHSRAPSAARLFYAWEAVRYCRALAAAFTEDSNKDLERFRAYADSCERLAQTNPNFGQFQARYDAAAARMPESEKELLDAIDGRLGAAASQPFPQRLATVAGADDPYLVGAVGVKWAARPDVTYDGRQLTPAEKTAFVTAWNIVSCEAAGNCESSEPMAYLCAAGMCEGTLRASLAKAQGPENMQKIDDAMAAIRRAMQSGDYSPFN